VEGLDMIFIDASNGLAANEVEAIQKAVKGKKQLGCSTMVGIFFGDRLCNGGRL